MISIANIQTAIKELLLGSIGTTRTVTASSLSPNSTSGIRAQSLVRTTFDVTFGEITNNAANAFSVRTNYRLVDLPVSIAITKHLPSPIQITDRDTARSGLMYLADTVLQAVSYPGNLSATSTSAATGIVSGCLIGARIGGFEEDWDTKQLISLTITGTAIVQVSQSV